MTMMLAPAWAKRMAAPAPMPWDPPAMTAVLPVKSIPLLALRACTAMMYGVYGGESDVEYECSGLDLNPVQGASPYKLCISR
jgi:hypothetical protein